MNTLERALVSAICYYDVFDCPLTLIELWRWAYGKAATLQEVMECVTSSNVLAQKLEFSAGYYFLRGRKAIVTTRRERYVYAETKFVRARRFARLARFVPFVRMVAVCNNLAFRNAREKSDIDVFIVVAKRRLWFARLVITLFAHVFGFRRHGKTIANRICLSFYVSEDHLQLKRLTLSPEDPYFVYWVSQLVTLYDQQTFGRFSHANEWIKDYLPNHFAYAPSTRFLVTDSRFSLFCKRAGEFIAAGSFGNMLERFSKSTQRIYMKRKTANKTLGRGTEVVIADDILKFHEEDRRVPYRAAWRERLQQFS